MESRTLSDKEFVTLCRLKAMDARDEGEYVKALSFLHSACARSDDYDILSDIADVYTDMELYELSNKYWFRYMDVAPKEKVSVAYEALALNLYCLDNVIECNYYLHKKLAEDGEFSNDRLTEEDVVNFMESLSKENDYRIVYPAEKADYSVEIKNAKRALAFGDFEGAIKEYEKVQEGAKQYAEAQRDLAVALFLSGETQKGIDSLRALIKNTGGDLCSYCNLASMYKYQDELHKSSLYYNFALSFKPSTVDEHFKLATCALEQNDIEVASENILIVLKERPYELALKNFYGQILINKGEYKKAQAVFTELYTINPDCYHAQFYAKLCEGLQADGKESKSAKKLLPLTFVEAVPEEEFNVRAKKINELAKAGERKRAVALKNPQILETIKWGLSCGSDGVQRASAFLLAFGDGKCQRLLINELLTPDHDLEYKQLLTFILLKMGRKQKFSMVANNMFATVYPKKLAFDKDLDAEVFSNAYCLCLSKMAFMGKDICTKVAFTADKVYKAFKDAPLFIDYTAPEVASLIAILCVGNSLVPNDELISIFGANKERVNDIKLLYDGEKL